MSIFLTKSATTTVALSLAENTTLSGTPYYLFKFISGDNNRETLFTATDFSSNPQRYNLFYITVTGSTFTNYTAGTISLDTSGYYTYYIYQQTGQTNVSMTGVTGEPIEYGKMLLTGVTQFYGRNYWTGGTNSTRKVFQKPT